jgi:tRNA A37 N6-isopentenylltransferase MiaA
MMKIRDQVIGMSINERQIALFVMERLRDDLATAHLQTAEQLRAYITQQIDWIRAEREVHWITAGVVDSAKRSAGANVARK